jgi:hypothetical protein
MSIQYVLESLYKTIGQGETIRMELNTVRDQLRTTTSSEDPRAA